MRGNYLVYRNSTGQRGQVLSGTAQSRRNSAYRHRGAAGGCLLAAADKFLYLLAQTLHSCLPPEEESENTNWHLCQEIGNVNKPTASWEIQIQRLSVSVSTQLHTPQDCGIVLLWEIHYQLFYHWSPVRGKDSTRRWWKSKSGNGMNSELGGSNVRWSRILTMFH